MEGGCYDYIKSNVGLNGIFASIVENYPKIFHNHDKKETKTFFNCAIENLNSSYPELMQIFEIVRLKFIEGKNRILLIDTMNIYKNVIKPYDHLLAKYNPIYNLEWLHFARKYEGIKFVFLLLLSLIKCEDADIFFLIIPDNDKYIKYVEIDDKLFCLVSAKCYIDNDPHNQCNKSDVTGFHNESDDYIIMILYLLLKRIGNYYNDNINVWILTNDNYAWLKNNDLKNILLREHKKITIINNELYARLSDNTNQSPAITIYGDIIPQLRRQSSQLSKEQIDKILRMLGINKQMVIVEYNDFIRHERERLAHEQQKNVGNVYDPVTNQRRKPDKRNKYEYYKYKYNKYKTKYFMMLNIQKK